MSSSSLSAPAVAPPATVPADRRRARLVLAVLCVGQLMVILDGTIVNVALPTIQSALHLSPTGLAWVVDAYLVPFGGLLLVSGRLGDLVGRARVFQAGLALFTLASLLCGLATGDRTLLAFRFAQGVGGAVASSVALALVLDSAPGPAERGRALGVYSFVQSAGGTLGLLLGGVLTQLVGWHWIFLVNVPIGAVTLAVSLRVLKDPAPAAASTGDRLRRLDATGAALATLALMAAVAAVSGTSEHAWTSPLTLAPGAAALLLAVGFAVRQARAADPLVPARVLASRDVLGALAAHGLVIAGMFGFQFLVVQALQRLLHEDQIRTGLAMAPISLLIGAVSLVAAPRLLARLGARTALLPALLLIALGLAWLGRLPAHPGYAADVLPALLALGAGFGLAMPALAGLAMSAAAPRDAGIASGVFNTVQQVAAVLGLATLGALAAAHAHHAVGATSADHLTALAAGYRLAFRAAAALATAALVVAATVLNRRPRQHT